MNLPNKLTVLRVALVPVFLVVLYLNFPGARYVALGVFILAACTDLLDGYLARRMKRVTDFGKFMDPLADKILVLSAMCWLVQNGTMRGWVVALVLLREFAVSGLRMIAVEQGTVIAAAKSGKVKTAVTIVCICVMLVCSNPVPDTICQVLILATTLWSGAEYFIKNADVFRAMFRR